MRTASLRYTLIRVATLLACGRHKFSAVRDVRPPTFRCWQRLLPEREDQQMLCLSIENQTNTRISP